MADPTSMPELLASLLNEIDEDDVPTPKQAYEIADEIFRLGMNPVDLGLDD